MPLKLILVPLAALLALVALAPAAAAADVGAPAACAGALAGATASNAGYVAGQLPRHAQAFAAGEAAAAGQWSGASVYWADRGVDGAPGPALAFLGAAPGNPVGAAQALYYAETGLLVNGVLVQEVLAAMAFGTTTANLAVKATYDSAGNVGQALGWELGAAAAFVSCVA